MLSSGRKIGPDALHEYLQGTLPRPGAELIEAALRDDPALAAQVHLLERQNMLLQELGADILDEPVPERMMSILRQAEPAGTRHRPLPPPAPPRADPWRRRGSGVRVVLLVLATGIGIFMVIGIG